MCAVKHGLQNDNTCSQCAVEQGLQNDNTGSQCAVEQGLQNDNTGSPCVLWNRVHKIKMQVPHVCCFILMTSYCPAWHLMWVNCSQR